MMMELNRVSSHLVALATGGLELGALTAMEFGFRERELVMDIFEMVSGLRMNTRTSVRAASPRICPRTAPRRSARRSRCCASA